ncbi:MAG: Twin-arginine translocation pathway signal [Proteobacteria bacterium]|jgi:hypothetical protein|nr:MAG: Twin-arginine translocation pathway signal [Pseudomonadota bacterium]
MSQTLEASGQTGLDRRQFLARTTAAAALMTISGNALLHTTEAWGLEAKALKPEVMRTIIKMARDIYPHDRLADKYYAIACKTYDEKAASDPALKSLCEEGVKHFDAVAMQEHKVPYVEVPWEAQRVAILRANQDNPFFQKLRGDLVVNLYNQKEVWPLFGYEGESASKGGYIDRGFNDIEWL